MGETVERHDDGERARILAALHTWVRQRPGLEYGNYGDITSYRAELRSIGRDLRDAETLLAHVARRDAITADDLKRALAGSFSGRLSWDGARLDYCTGQYWPTEYRRAVCAVLGSALFAYFREHCTPAGLERPGDHIRKQARLAVGATLQRRWLD